jgi:hypothetical protein
MAFAFRWHAHQQVGFSSRRVEILFRAIYDTNNEIAAKAAAAQGRDVVAHIAELVSPVAAASAFTSN